MDSVTKLVARLPEPDSIAACVKLQRAQRRWKQQTLAGKAEVSLSTVQRVERAEAVSPEALEKIAAALGLPKGSFTTPRIKLTEEEALAFQKESTSWMEDRMPVTVAPFRTEAQLRALSKTEMCIVDNDMGEEAQQDATGLREWIDLAGFMRLQTEGVFMNKPERSFRARELYGDVFEHLKDMERRHNAVCLVGTYTAATDNPNIPEVTVALIALRSKERNPAAAKLDSLWVEKLVPWHAAMENGE